MVRFPSPQSRRPTPRLLNVERMSKTKSLIHTAWTSVVNPGQDERVAFIVSLIGKELHARRSAFDLDQVLQPIGCTTNELTVATKVYYERLLVKFWRKGIPSDKQKKTLAFVAEKLGLKSGDVSRWNEAIAATYFGALVAEVLADGVVTDAELRELSQISSFVGQPAQAFLRRHLYDEGLGFLRGVFADATATGVLDPRLWDNLVRSAQLIGLSPQELTTAVAPLARSFAEHVLADTKVDGHLSGSEEAYLSWLLKSFAIDESFDAYVRQEMTLLRERTQIATGNLKSIDIPKGINLQAGEIPYFLQRSTLRSLKQLKSGPRYEDHVGYLLLTDNRLLFQSPTKPVNISYRAIIGWNAAPDRIAVTIPNKPEYHFLFPGGQFLLAEKFDALVRLHSQALQREKAGGSDRHIPHDVRQRVWQRYGGKCADCRASEYLEFDHIVPVAKGGGSSEQNVQILCRRCNSNKSDKI